MDISDKMIRLYTEHGERKLQGIPLVINEKKALAWLSKGKIVAYTTLDELQQVFYAEKLPECKLNF